MGINALSSVQANDSWLGLQSRGDVVTESQRLVSVVAVWQWPKALLQTGSHASGAGRSGQEWITPEQRIRHAPEENKSATCNYP